MRALLAALLMMPACMSYAEAPPQPSQAAIAATLQRDTVRCRVKSDLDACYDAVRRNPGDSSLSVALGDALSRSKRSADALRSYRRAAAMAPHTPGLAAKINMLELHGAGKRVDRDPLLASAKRFSNLAIEGQSH